MYNEMYNIYRKYKIIYNILKIKIIYNKVNMRKIYIRALALTFFL